MKPLGLLIGLAVMVGCGDEPPIAAPVRLEFRAAETEPSEGLVELTIWTGEAFYIADSVLLENRDVARALIAVRDGKPEIELFLTEEGTRRWARATELRNREANRNAGRRQAHLRPPGATANYRWAGASSRELLG